MSAVTAGQTSGAGAPPPSCGEVLDLGDVALRDGSRLVLRRLAPPAPEYAERLGVLLDHKPPPVIRKIRRQLSAAWHERLEALTGQGFELLARLPDYCRDDAGARHDAVILRWRPQRRPPESQGSR